MNENFVFQAELHDVPDDQEITFQPELFDQREFTFDLLPRLFVIWTEAFPRAFVGALAEKRRHRFVIADRILRKFVAEILQGELQAGRKARRVLAIASGRSCEEPRHLRGVFR